jgi:hypothetical protein
MFYHTLRIYKNVINTRMSSMNATTNLSSSGTKTEFMRYKKCASAFVNPNDMTRYSKRPYLVVKAILGISFTQILIWL